MQHKSLSLFILTILIIFLINTIKSQEIEQSFIIGSYTFLNNSLSLQDHIQDIKRPIDEKPIAITSISLEILDENDEYDNSNSSLRLHHLTFRNNDKLDFVCGGKERFAGFGQEMTKIEFPMPYIYELESSDRIEIFFRMIRIENPNIDLKNQTFSIKYTFTYYSIDKFKDGEKYITIDSNMNDTKIIKPLTPFYLDITGCEGSSTYILTGTGENESKSIKFFSPISGYFIYGLGHLDRFGVEITLSTMVDSLDEAVDKKKDIDDMKKNILCTSKPIYSDSQSSQILNMTSCEPMKKIKNEETLTLTSTYKSNMKSKASGVMLLYLRAEIDEKTSSNNLFFIFYIGLAVIGLVIILIIIVTLYFIKKKENKLRDKRNRGRPRRENLSFNNDDEYDNSNYQEEEMTVMDYIGNGNEEEFDDSYFIPDELLSTNLTDDEEEDGEDIDFMFDNLINDDEEEK